MYTLIVSMGVLALAAIGQTQQRAGYTDTPMLPGGKWHVHDPARPDGPTVDPGSGAPGAVPARPPSDAVVLFDGSGLSKWQTMVGKPPAWIVNDGYIEVPPPGTPNGGDIRSAAEFGPCQLHVEFMIPAVIKGEEHSFERGNSGVFLQGLYEVQIFDSWQNDYLYADGQCGAIYGQYPPLVNACRKPTEWQSYDILFAPARFAEGKLRSPAYITVFQNGVCVQDHVALLGPTGHRVLASYTQPIPSKGPVVLQAHGSAVRFRSIWIRQLLTDDAAR